MKLFISWAGPESKKVASKLREWIPFVLQKVYPWVSGTDIVAGARWSLEVLSKLNEMQFGIICLTPSNQNAPWILFEAGALAKTLSDTYVCPYLICMQPEDMIDSPLKQFQAKCADQEGTFNLISSINKALKDDAIREDVLRKTFDYLWPELEKVLKDISIEIASSSARQTNRSNHKDTQSDQLLRQMTLRLEEAERQKIEELLQDAIMLRRSRFVYTSPDPDLQRQTAVYRGKMDFTTRSVIDSWTEASSPKIGSRYGEIYLRRGVIAYYDGQMEKCCEMLKTAEQFFPYSDAEIEAMPPDQKVSTAFTQFYLALIEKNYGDMQIAKEHIEKSYKVRGSREEDEILTPTTRAEILSYLGEMNDARLAIQEVLNRSDKLKQRGPLARHDAIYELRARLLLGNEFYLNEEWDEALKHYNSVLKEDMHRVYSYYAYYSISQVHQQLGKSKDSKENRRKAYEELIISKHLQQKVALDTLILLNALAFRCTRDEDHERAKIYRDDMNSFLDKIHEFNGLQLRLFSFKQKRLLSKDEFRVEIFGD